MYVHPGNCMLDGAQQIPVEKSVEVTRQPALNTNFCCATFPSLARAAHHFLERKRVCVRGSGPSCKAAKTAPHETHIGEIDVSIDDKSDNLSDRLSPQLVGNSH